MKWGVSKKFLIFPAALVLSTVAVFAQMPGPGGPPGDLDGPPVRSPAEAPQAPQTLNARKLLGRLSKDLKLSEDQKTRIKPILETEQRQAEVLVKSAISRTEQNHQLDEIEQNGWTEIRPILTGAQQKKLDVLAKSMAAKRERTARRLDTDEDGPPAPPDGPPPPQ